MFFHKVRVICGGGHMVCIKKGCDVYHGVTIREHSLFFLEKVRQDYLSGLGYKFGGGRDE